MPSRCLEFALSGRPQSAREETTGQHERAWPALRRFEPRLPGRRVGRSGYHAAPPGILPIAARLPFPAPTVGTAFILAAVALVAGAVSCRIVRRVLSKTFEQASHEGRATQDVSGARQACAPRPGDARPLQPLSHAPGLKRWTLGSFLPFIVARMLPSIGQHALCVGRTAVRDARARLRRADADRARPGQAACRTALQTRQKISKRVSSASRRSLRRLAELLPVFPRWASTEAPGEIEVLVVSEDGIRHAG